ncbi:alpha/beta fold hydrolase [Streptomyces sp. NPDC008001]|uniref:alpha/beta hydrolase n=1 Tax=Streptomyces sp. NPDC008001 TaxID=3364804 RepID=UPI0036E335C8
MLAAALLTAVTTVVAVTTAGCTGNNGGSSTRTGAATRAAEAPRSADDPAGQKLDWKACPPPTSAEGGSSGRTPGPDWECATLQAPLDYAKPRSNGNTIGIALIRAKATDKARRIGSLVFNFGGPGGSGITTLPAFADDYRNLRSRYDLVSFDPRGVGRSSGVTCLTDRELDAYYAADAAPATEAGEKALVERVTSYAAGCERNSGKVLPHVGTENAARDMDLMRQVLGDAKLHYFGVSYGTELGGVYAHLFPDKVGRALLDGVVDPTADPVQSALAQAQGFQLALTNYMDACTKTSDNCPTEAGIRALLDRLGRKPIPGAGGRDLTRSLATSGIAQSLYSKDFWDYLTEGLEDAENGDGRLLLSLGDAMNGRGQDGRYSTLQSSLNAITCADFSQRYTAAEIEQRVPEFRKASPVFGDFMAWSLTQCTGWPVKGAWQTPDVSAKGSAPVLVVGNTGDPATPYGGAKHMAQELGPGVAAELTYRGEGHGAYDSGNACVKGAVDAYLLDGTVPEPDKICS